MIDDKKIEEATRDYIDKNGYLNKYDEDPCVDIEFAYKDGAKWAINELSKDLVHLASENAKIALLKEISIYYSGQTINSIIQNLTPLFNGLAPIPSITRIWNTPRAVTSWSTVRLSACSPMSMAVPYRNGSSPLSRLSSISFITRKIHSFCRQPAVMAPRP